MKPATESGTPAVSIVIPYFEGRRFIGSAIRSVLGQEGIPWEIIVIDDGSLDPASDALAAFDDPRIRRFRIEHSGKGAALNRGVREAKTDILCFLDQDDTMLPSRLAMQAKVLVERSAVDGIYSDYERVREDGTVIGSFTARPASNDRALHSLATGSSLLSMQTLMLRREAFARTGGFSEDIALTGLDDGEFFVRLLLSGARLSYQPGVAARWTLHDGNYSNSKAFRETRLVFIDRLAELAHKHPALRRELPYFRAHAHFMRGTGFLADGAPRRAVPELVRMIQARPAFWPAYYLLGKALLLALFQRDER